MSLNSDVLTQSWVLQPSHAKTFRNVHTCGQFVRYTLVVLVVPVPHCNHSHDYGIGLAECQVNSDGV